ncbi:MAG: hypothetical protein LBK61_12365 [Spirochaetaceae bacterium]|jgi:hypothetical protein|nr:hypothetical protein [Spirochaetaceae bacterium]
MEDICFCRRKAAIGKMRLKAGVGILAGVLIAVSCATRQQTEDRYEEAIAPPVPRSYIILEHKNVAREMPEWLQCYLDADERRAEELPAYTGDYIFVINEKGGGLSALAKWSEYFRIEQDFSHAVFLRMYNRLLTESGGRTDYYLGDFFEVFLKKIAGYDFSGAAREDDYWIKVAFEQGAADTDTTDGDTENVAETRDEYRYYILVKVNKISLQEEITALFADAYAEVTLDKLQAGVISRLQSTLFSGF